MRILSLDVAVVALVAIFMAPAISAADEVRVSPHSESGDCSVCHVAPKDTLRGWFVFGSTKRELKDDLNKSCLQCHTVEPSHGGGFLGVGKGHATGKKPSINRKDLPLSSDGTVNCAMTCHNVHVSSDDKTLQRKLLRMSVNDLCYSCHNM
jgi:predicted CXXCH cytochrome family protein